MSGVRSRALVLLALAKRQLNDPDFVVRYVDPVVNESRKTIRVYRGNLVDLEDEAGLMLYGHRPRLIIDAANNNRQNPVCHLGIGPTVSRRGSLDYLGLRGLRHRKISCASCSVFACTVKVSSLRPSTSTDFPSDRGHHVPQNTAKAASRRNASADRRWRVWAGYNPGHGHARQKEVER